MIKKFTFPQARDKAKELNYKFTQEGDTIHLETPKIKTTFPHKSQFALWMWYHCKLDLSGEYEYDDNVPAHRNDTMVDTITSSNE